MKTAESIRSRAEAAGAQLMPLLARAEKLASAVLPGGHGRRRAGQGDDFWQYRPVQAGDTLRMVDWRRSARSDAQFVQQKEWMISQSVHLWVDRSQSMQFASRSELPEKVDRAQVVALAISILLSRAGERISLLDEDLPARSGAAHLKRIASALCSVKSDDYAAPKTASVGRYGAVIFVSDFLGEIDAAEAAIWQAAANGAHGVCLQILDPVEEAFPFRGRTIFQSVGQSLQHDTLQAADLADRYKERLAERKARLAEICRKTGWAFETHHTSESAQAALLWLYKMIERKP